MRKFEICKGYEKIATIPTRSTKFSAGYDFHNDDHDISLRPQESAMIKTGIKAIMPQDEALFIYIRSSLAIKRGLQLSNNVAVIDSDYANNPDNEGNIMLKIVNVSGDVQTIKPFERIAQGIFTKYNVVDNDLATGERVGGMGSTGTI